ncbi:MAG: hypothetical protein M1383_00415 [Patescibacteria group bacterium]|nr:hypothetical protein [Patescibacteria group bacterium]
MPNPEYGMPAEALEGKKINSEKLKGAVLKAGGLAAAVTFLGASREAVLALMGSEIVNNSEK